MLCFIQCQKTVPLYNLCDFAIVYVRRRSTVMVTLSLLEAETLIRQFFLLDKGRLTGVRQVEGSKGVKSTYSHYRAGGSRNFSTSYNYTLKYKTKEER